MTMKLVISFFLYYLFSFVVGFVINSGFSPLFITVSLAAWVISLSNMMHVNLGLIFNRYPLNRDKTVNAQKGMFLNTACLFKFLEKYVLNSSHFDPLMWQHASLRPVFSRRERVLTADVLQAEWRMCWRYLKCWNTALHVNYRLRHLLLSVSCRKPFSLQAFCK